MSRFRALPRWSTPALTAAGAILLSATLAAQGSPPNPANENDIAGTVSVNGGDLINTYSDPSPGSPAGTAASVATAIDDEDAYWKVYSKDVLNSCTDAMEIAGLTLFIWEQEFSTTDGGPNGFNVAFGDLIFSRSNGGVGSVVPGSFEPDFADPNATLLQFGPSDVFNNSTLPFPGCPPVGYLYGYVFDVPLSTGAGNGIFIVADGATDLVMTAVVPGGHTYSGPNACGPTGGTGSMPDLHSSDKLGGIGETQFDLLSGAGSAFGGFRVGGAFGGLDGVHEVAVQSIQIFEPALAMRVNSATGVGGEEGLASVHYNCPAGSGGQLGARLYAWQGINRPAAVVGTLAQPGPGCLNFAGGKLGLSPVDPLFPFFLAQWQGKVIQTDNGDPAFGLVFDDGTFDTPLLSLPPQLIPMGVTVPLSFQGFYRTAPGGPIVGSQVRKLFLHG